MTFSVYCVFVLGSKLFYHYKSEWCFVCDINNTLRRNFGVPKTIGFIEGRVTYIIDSNGIIVHIFEDLLNGPAHIKEAIKALKKLQNN